MELYKYLAIIVYTVAGIAGLIVVCFTWLIQRVKYQHLHLEKRSRRRDFKPYAMRALTKRLLSRRRLTLRRKYPRAFLKN